MRHDAIENCRSISPSEIAIKTKASQHSLVACRFFSLCLEDATTICEPKMTVFPRMTRRYRNEMLSKILCKFWTPRDQPPLVLRRCGKVDSYSGAFCRKASLAHCQAHKQMTVKFHSKSVGPNHPKILMADLCHVPWPKPCQHSDIFLCGFSHVLSLVDL